MITEQEYKAALKLIDDYRHQLKGEHMISDLDISTRAYFAIMNNSRYLFEGGGDPSTIPAKFLQEITEDELIRHRGFGKVVIGEIKEALGKIGLSLKQ